MVGKAVIAPLLPAIAQRITPRQVNNKGKCRHDQVQDEGSAAAEPVKLERQGDSSQTESDECAPRPGHGEGRPADQDEQPAPHQTYSYATK